MYIQYIYIYYIYIDIRRYLQWLNSTIHDYMPISYNTKETRFLSGSQACGILPDACGWVLLSCWVGPDGFTRSVDFQFWYFWKIHSASKIAFGNFHPYFPLTFMATFDLQTISGVQNQAYGDSVWQPCEVLEDEQQ